MTEKVDFSHFIFAEKFTHLPCEMCLQGDTLIFMPIAPSSELDMVPAGLKGIKGIVFDHKPLFIAPDFDGHIMYPGARSVDGSCMSEAEMEQAKARYSAYREMVEKPRYIKARDGSLLLCSLPKNMNFIYKRGIGRFLDLTYTDVVKRQKFDGIQKVILYPKKDPSLEIKTPRKVISHNKPQMVHSKPRIKE